MKRKKLRYLFLVLVFFGIMLICSTDSQANTVTKLQKAININADGSAKVAEIWDIETDAKTEIYVPWDNLGDSEIRNLTVSDDRGAKYETLPSWNTKATFLEKKEKCGINTTSTGIEVCWGISEYGTRRYKVTYDITNFVKECNDSQYVYWQVFPKNFGLPVKSILIRIQSKNGFNETNSKIWAFGYPNGKINFTEEGYIMMDSNGKLPSSEYMTLLIKLEEKNFTVTSKNSKNFQEIYDKAMKGTENEKEVDIKKAINIMIGIAILLTILILISIIKKFIKWIKTPIYEYDTIYEGGQKMPSIKDVDYVRDISQIGISLDEAYYLALEYNLINSKERSNIMGAILLKWIKNGMLTLQNARSGIFDFWKKQYSIDIKELARAILNDPTEQELKRILQKAAGADYLLEPKEFVNYCKEKNSSVEKFFKEITKRVDYNLRAQNEIVEKRPQSKRLLRTVKHQNTVYTAILREKAIKLLGLKRYLLDYSLIASREAIEVELWDEYLVYAQILGIADKVEEQFNSIYPDYQTIINLNDVDQSTPKLISTITSSYVLEGFEIAEKWRKKELEEERRSMREASSSSFSSYSNTSDSHRDYGGGGSSYSGGGSGASGSSSGGGAR